MIISASYRTDIPAFYRLMNRLAAGWAKANNPYGEPAIGVDPTPQAVGWLCFWDPKFGAIYGLFTRNSPLRPERRG